MKTINIKISDKEYNLRTEPKDEAILREAARLLEIIISSKRQTMKITNVQDLLAMTAFDLMVEKLREMKEVSEISQTVNNLNDRIERTLSAK